MIGDLHCHSKLSDSSMGLESLLFYAKRMGLDFIAVTDHDTLVIVTLERLNSSSDNMTGTI